MFVGHAPSLEGCSRQLIGEPVRCLEEFLFINRQITFLSMAQCERNLHTGKWELTPIRSNNNVCGAGGGGGESPACNANVSCCVSTSAGGDADAEMNGGPISNEFVPVNGNVAVGATPSGYLAYGGGAGGGGGGGECHHQHQHQQQLYQSDPYQCFYCWNDDILL